MTITISARSILRAPLDAFQFLSQQGQGPNAHKHTTWKHPILVCLLHYTITTAILLPLHDYYVQLFNLDTSINIGTTIGIGDMNNTNTNMIINTHPQDKSQQIAAFTIQYFTLLITYRILQNKPSPLLQKACLYENTWLCNSTLYFGAIGLYTHRPLLVTAHLIVVSIDQILWYVDLTGWFLSSSSSRGKIKRFPIGVAKYLTWPETSVATRVTCTHHLWTIPVLLYGCWCWTLTHGNGSGDGNGNVSIGGGGNGDGNGLTLQDFMGAAAYGFSAIVMSLSVGLSRWMTPFFITDEDAHAANASTNANANANANAKTSTKYLNVNLSHELWKDITFEFLQIQHDNPSTGMYLFRLLWRWQLLNGIVFVLVLRPLSLWFFL